jgi:putative transcriptional regulator
MPASEHPPSSADSLKGKLLLAMPNLEDPRFDRAVILMLEHNANGAMGLIINKPLEGVLFEDLLQQLKITVTSPESIEVPVLFGGPVEIGRGFVVHSPEVILSQTMRLSDDLAVTTMTEMLGQIATGQGPQERLFCLGYAGWTAGQLDDEIKQNAWLHAPIKSELLFHLACDKKWDAAMHLAGIDPSFLTAKAGHA